MWEVTYTISPDRGYFDTGEPLMWDANIYLKLIHSIEFISDGTVAIVYEVEGDVDLLMAGIDEADTRSFEYTVTRESEPSSTSSVPSPSRCSSRSNTSATIRSW